MFNNYRWYGCFVSWYPVPSNIAPDIADNNTSCVADIVDNGSVIFVTIIDGKGGYTNNDKSILLVVVNNKKQEVHLKLKTNLLILLTFRIYPHFLSIIISLSVKKI